MVSMENLIQKHIKSYAEPRGFYDMQHPFMNFISKDPKD